MSDRRKDAHSSFEVLSALVDGEASDVEVARTCQAWRDDSQLRAQWGRYQFISDALKSDDLVDVAVRPDFLNRFRERLAQEPVVLAPAVSTGRPVVLDHVASMAGSVPSAGAAVSGDLSYQPLHRRTWSGPVAVAACFVAVVGVLVLQGRRDLDGGAIEPQLAQTQVPMAVSRADEPAVVLTAGNALMTDSAAPASFNQAGMHSSQPMWRDAQLDHALSDQQAEHSFASRGGLVRTVAFESP